MVVAPARAAGAVSRGRPGRPSYETDRTGLRQIFVRAFPGGDQEAQISTEGGRHPRWAADGHSLYFQGGGAILTVEVFDRSGALAPGEAQILFEGPFRSAFVFDVSQDGERFLLVRIPEGQEPRIHVVQNWLAELERLVPTD